MQNDQQHVHHERLEDPRTSQSGPRTSDPKTSNDHTKNQTKSPKNEEPFAMVLLPKTSATTPSSRHSRPLPIPHPPGAARRVSAAQCPPRAPPRPQHTLTSKSRPIVNRPTTQKPTPPPSSAPTCPPPVMELVSLPPVVPPKCKVSLTTPRPEPDRETNLYTEAPKKLPTALPQKSHTSVITQQPIQPHQKSHVTTLLSNSSIFCQVCGKCKCEACCRPRKLPQKWLCGGTCLCSKTTVVDTLSCMCCVKGLFYHCTKDSEIEIDPNNNPCACAGNNNGVRWATMTLLCPVLPCLLTYPILGACAKVTEMLYAKCTASGCTCDYKVKNNLHPPSLNKIVDSPPEKSFLVQQLTLDHSMPKQKN